MNTTIQQKYRTNSILNFIKDFVIKHKNVRFKKIDVNKMSKINTMEGLEEYLGEDEFERMIFVIFNIFDNKSAGIKAIKQVIKNDPETAEKYIDNYIITTTQNYDKNHREIKPPSYSRYAKYYTTRQNKKINQIFL